MFRLALAAVGLTMALTVISLTAGLYNSSTERLEAAFGSRTEVTEISTGSLATGPLLQPNIDPDAYPWQLPTIGALLAIGAAGTRAIWRA